METPDYSAVETGLQQANAEMTAAEMHGMLCGLLSVKGSLSHKDWLDLLFESRDDNDVLMQELVRSLSLLHLQTLRDLNDPELGFHLFMPQDSQPVNERIRALGLWCSGYLYGIGLHLQQSVVENNPQLQEVIEDFREISRVHLIDAIPEEEQSSEEDLFEISEYVRMAVLMVYDMLQPVAKKEISVH